MKRVLTSILLMTLITATAHAGPSGKGQGQGMRGQGQGQRAAHIQQALGLSEAQMEQIREIRANGGGRDEIRAVLTDEQRATMDAHRAARQGQGNRPPRGERDGQGQGYRGGSDSAPPGEDGGVG